MSTLKDLEKDVHQFLANLAQVRRVNVEASVNTQGRKHVTAITFVGDDSRDTRFRVYQTEQHLMERHGNVDFDFSCTTLKEKHEQRPLGAAQTA